MSNYDDYTAAMSVDVEDWFQVENLKSAIDRDSWDQQEFRVAENTGRILDIFDHANVKATFFILGWVAERFPSLVEAIHAAGHEIASHGYGHELVYNQSPEAFREDVKRSCDFLTSVTGSTINGYRAPSFSITDWSIDVLADLGLTWDSSSFPTIGHDRYGKLSGDDPTQLISELRDGFREVKISSLPLGRNHIPWGGGGYFRAIPYSVYRAGVRNILRKQGQFVFYIHPWEVDPGQPRVHGIKASHRFRHYLNLSRCESRLKRLVKDFRWTTIAQLLKEKTDPSSTSVS